MRAWQRLPEILLTRNVVFLNYEVISTEPIRMLQFLSDNFGLEVSASFVHPHRNQRGKKYVPKRYEQYNEVAFDQLNSLIDWEVEQDSKYHRVTELHHLNF